MVEDIEIYVLQAILDPVKLIGYPDVKDFHSKD